MWTVGVAFGMWGVIGLVVDSGRSVRDRSEAFGVAAQAARFGTQELDRSYVALHGDLLLDEEAAEQAAANHLRDRGLEDYEIEVGEVEVSVTVSDETGFTMWPGAVPFTVSATATVAAGSGGREVDEGEPVDGDEPIDEDEPVDRDELIDRDEPIDEDEAVEEGELIDVTGDDGAEEGAWAPSAR